MAYEKQQWENGAEGGTPISADRLNHMEDGIADAEQDLGDYAKKSELGDYAKKSELGDLAGKDESDLNLSQYAQDSELQSLISRVEALENAE